MKRIYIEAKTLEEAYEQAEIELKATRDQIDFKVEEEKKLFSKSYKVTATLLPNYPMKGLEYLKKILESLGIKAIVEMRKKQNKEIRYVITSEENPILIGKGGKTLEAIQTLVRCVVNNDLDEASQYQVAVDCGGYKENRLKHLEILATKTAKDVAQSQVEARLEPMNSFERRIVHAKLAEWRDVYTESEGEGKDRHIVIKPRKRKTKIQDQETVEEI
ncbi:KH domain-containing protein [bacterium]|nr:KH domain-containing protein [bacterium]